MNKNRGCFCMGSPRAKSDGILLDGIYSGCLKIISKDGYPQIYDYIDIIQKNWYDELVIINQKRYIYIYDELV
jgi:hypothetical protein